MQLSPKTRYAIRILYELDGTTEPLSAAHISERTGITLRTVEKISAVLRLHKVTTSVMGAGGGIKLQKSLSVISLGQLITFFDAGVEFGVCCGNKSNNCPNQSSCTNRKEWRAVSAKIQQELDAITLDTIIVSY